MTHRMLFALITILLQFSRSDGMHLPPAATKIDSQAKSTPLAAGIFIDHRRDGQSAEKTQQDETEMSYFRAQLQSVSLLANVSIDNDVWNYTVSREWETAKNEAFHTNMSRLEVRSLQGRLMLDAMDLNTDPCSDFYQYSCGNWHIKYPTPEDAVGFDTFEKLRESINVALRDLLEEEVNEVDNGAIVKAKYLYQSCLNLELIEAKREQPLLHLLTQLGGWPILSDAHWSSSLTWIDLLSLLRLHNNDVLISMWVGPDGKDSDCYIIQLDQGDLGLPSRVYYLDGENATSVLAAYADFIRDTALALGGQKDVVEKDVKDILEFETELAMILSSAEDRRNFSSMYRKITIAELNTMAQTIPWTRYLSTLLNNTVNESDRVVIYASDYFLKLDALINATIENKQERTLFNYLLWRFIRHRLNNLDQRFQDLKQNLYAVLFGRKQQPERWKYCVAYVNSNMGMAVGSLFVRNFFGEESKNDTTQLVAEVQHVFSNIIHSSSWLDYDTKQLANEKLSNMNLKVGYPEYILNGTALEVEYKEIGIHPEDYFNNVLQMLRFMAQSEFKRLNRIVDRHEWSTTPAVVNAYYSRTRNQIMIPAGILQPPFYDARFPKALNYGGIGVVIGHEIIHGFDDQGRQFDAQGNIRSWWPEETAENFELRTKCIVDQYSNYTNEIDGMGIQISGIITQGENIADNGGVRQAFKAYERWLTSNPDQVGDEYLPELNVTGKQLFFLSFAQIWCGNLRPEAALSRMRTAIHAPGRFRVIGSLSNMEEFSEAFSCPEGSEMSSADRCIVW